MPIDITTFAIVLVVILIPMITIGFTTVKQAGFFGFIFGALEGLICLIVTNTVPIWSLLIFIVALSAYLIFERK